MYFQYPSTSRVLVQTINILCDHALQGTVLLPTGEDTMSRIGDTPGKVDMRFGLLSPILLPRLFACQKLIVIHRFVSSPHATR